MVLRLILVGLVAGLGLSLPTRRDVDTMARSAQHWMNTRLAAWDPQTPSDSGPLVFIVEPAAPPLAVASRSPISDELFADLIGETVARFAQDDLAGTTRELDQAVKSRDEIAALETSRSLAIAPPTEPVLVAGDEATIAELAFDGSSRAAEQDIPAAAADLSAVDRRDREFAGMIEATVDRFAQDASSLVKADQTPGDDLLEIGENLYTGEAYALNRLSEGMQEPGTSGEATGREGNRLTNAVRLTREAVVAWASLLHGPAVITIAP